MLRQKRFEAYILKIFGCVFVFIFILNFEKSEFWGIPRSNAWTTTYFFAKGLKINILLISRDTCISQDFTATEFFKYLLRIRTEFSRTIFESGKWKNIQKFLDLELPRNFFKTCKLNYTTTYERTAVTIWSTLVMMNLYNIGDFSPFPGSQVESIVIGMTIILTKLPSFLLQPRLDYIYYIDIPKTCSKSSLLL